MVLATQTLHRITIVDALHLTTAIASVARLFKPLATTQRIMRVVPDFMPDVTTTSSAMPLRPITADDLELILAWRNSAHVRYASLDQHLITLEEHHAWFERTKANSRYRCLLFYEDALPIGAGTFTEINGSTRSARWGFYTAPTAPKGTGTRLCTALLNYAFDKLPIDTLYAEVLMTSHASVRLHEKLGFIVVDDRFRLAPEPRRGDTKWLHISRGNWAHYHSLPLLSGDAARS